MRAGRQGRHGRHEQMAAGDQAGVGPAVAHGPGRGRPGVGNVGAAGAAGIGAADLEVKGVASVGAQSAT